MVNSWRNVSLWAIAPEQFPRVSTLSLQSEREAAAQTEEPRKGKIGIVRISGPIYKGSMFGADSIKAKNMIRAFTADPSVSGMMLVFDSPGGETAGLASLIDVVRAARAAKPVYAYVDDLAASAAYWIASQADRIYAGRGSEVGSIGVFSLVVDATEAYAKEGIKVHLVSSGGIKGAGAFDVNVSDELLANIQSRVDETYQEFVGDVAQGRRLEHDAVVSLADGRMLGAKAAMDAGLIDGIAEFETALTELGAASIQKTTAGRAKKRLALARLERSTVLCR